jgi:hypothetical protein
VSNTRCSNSVCCLLLDDLQETLPRTANREQNMYGLLPKNVRCDGTYERPADAFLSGSMSDCAVKGFARNAMHPESKAAVRTAGLSLAVM